uniref:calcium-transporting ATPase 12, plasma membrane-type-like n=1 Tax=Erigeron canadensis TaxID=72917 RepID=UPI001CB9BEAE|nr:calcium-transporting ATPase 12, plasma membrane-type-like [Erigeron canadensis]
MNNLTMANEIILQIDIELEPMLNISTVTFSRAQKRWRLAYHSISFSNTLRSYTELPKKYSSITEILAAVASHTAPETSPNATNIDANVEELWGVDQSALAELMKNKDLDMLRKFNGVEGLAKSLHTTLEHGINGQDIERRKTAFGSNVCSKPTPKPFWSFVVGAFGDPTIVILLIAAAFSSDINVAEERWGEGLKILVSLGMALVVSSVTSFFQERQFDSLPKRSNNAKIDAIREGRRQKVLVSDVVVGDIVCLSVGDQIPANGLIINGHSLLINVSRMTGETKYIHDGGTDTAFLYSGSKVADGNARMLVISVGVDTASASDSNETTQLQSRIGKLMDLIRKVGLIVSTLVLVIMLILRFTGYTRHKNGKWDCQQKHTDILDKLNSFTRMWIATAQDIRLAVTLTLAYCRKRLMGNHVMVRKLSACETMGSATVICTGKTGTLTMNKMQVGKFWVGLVHIKDDSLIRTINAKVLELYHQGVGLNTTGIDYNSETALEYSGNPTEKAILSWAVTKLAMDTEKLNQDYTILDVETFNSEKKRSMVSIRNNKDNIVHVHWKGAAEMVLAMCSNYYDRNGVIKSIDPEKKIRFEKIIRSMAESSLRCIAFAHKKKDNTGNEEELILLGIVGIRDQCRLGAKKAIENCRSAGVDIKMITGDNVFTAKAIATYCGILKPGQPVTGDGRKVITGEEFRSFTEDQRMEKVDSIRVMARSTPLDKLMMVECLRKKGHVVAVTGHDTDDAHALKEADIGLSMGIQGTEVVKESSDIVILNDDFGSIVEALRWGRRAYKNIRKFVKHQLTVTIAALAINSIATACATDAPLTVVQLLWVNILMDSLGAIALATECPAKELKHNLPMDRGAPILTNDMCRNILAQALYQIVLLSTFQFKGRSIFNVNEKVKNTMIFNTFVLCQVFNIFNSRKPDNRNVFKGVYKNYIFLGVIGITIIIQVVIVECLNNFADTEKLNRKQWKICIISAALSLPIGFVAKFIPVPNTPLASHKHRWI